jgi:hypothetical protein
VKMFQCRQGGRHRFEMVAGHISGWRCTCGRYGTTHDDAAVIACRPCAGGWCKKHIPTEPTQKPKKLVRAR